MKQERIYHILIDRFFPIRDEDTNGNFKGGCIKSIIEHLDYIQGLGMSGIMLTPFYKTAAYHGYHIVDFEQVDPHFGTNADVKELVNEVHKRGMVIVADFVANHCHKSCTLFSDGKHKDWFCYKSNGTYKCFAGIEDLPMFNSKNKDVQQYLTQKALDLCSMGFDAIRLDHATGPCYAFWKYFVRNVKAKYPKVRLIGEVWGELDFKPHNYIRYFLNKLRYDAQEARQLEYVGILDGVLDFRYQQFVCEAVHREKAIVNNRKLQEEVKLHFARYPTGFQLWLFLDNHDLNRFMFECDGNEKLFKEGINYSQQQKKQWLMFYGTEKEFTNKKSIFDGTPYADERVRMPILKKIGETMNRLFILLFAICFSASSYGQNAATLRKAKAGDAKSQYRIACAYQYGWDGAPKDDEKYVYWLKKAANGGVAEAQYYLGELYKSGEYGVSKDKSLYIKWAKKAAFNGSILACLSLGFHYDDIDKQEAIYWLKKGMDEYWKEFGEENETFAESLRELGVYYHPGDKSTYSTSSNSSHSTNPSSNSSNSVPTRQPQPVQEWNPCLGCGGTGLCTYCQGKGKRWYGNSYENCVTCHGSMYCQQCYGRKGYYTTVYR